MPLVDLAAELSWLVDPPRHVCPAERPAGIQRSGTVAVLDNARTPAMASVAGPRPACGVHLSGPSSRPWLSGHPVSGPSGVQSPGLVVRDPASGRLVSTRPVSSRPVSTPVRPGASVWSPIKRGVWGQADAARQPPPRERVEVPMAAASSSGSGRRPSRPGRATPPRSRMVGRGCRWRTRPGRVRAAAALDAGLPGRPGRRAERPVTSGCARARQEAAARGCRTGRVAAALGMGGRPRWVVVVEAAARVDGPEGPMGVEAGMGVRPQRGPGSQRAFPSCCRQRSDLRRWLVGLPGLEPGTSSLSAITRLPLCNPAFSQVAHDRRG
jgi:hypothetical protein